MPRSNRAFLSSLAAVLALWGLTSCTQNGATSSAVSDSSAATSNASPASESKEMDACKLVTKSEAEAVMGEKLKDPDSGLASMAGGTICRYESTDSLSARNVTIRVESPNFNWESTRKIRGPKARRWRRRRGAFGRCRGWEEMRTSHDTYCMC